MSPTDRPEDTVIENDRELDKWYQAYVREQARKQGRRASGSQDVAVPQFTPYRDDA